VWRDFIHVADLADAHVLAARRLDSGGETAAFNLGTGQGYSVKQVIATAERVTGTRINTIYRDRRSGDPPILVADRGSAQTEIGWRPCRSELHTQAHDAWRWHRMHFRLKSSGTATTQSGVVN
jgi:UDP-glucose 4-epimerase